MDVLIQTLQEFFGQMAQMVGGWHTGVRQWPHLSLAVYQLLGDQLDVCRLRRNAAGNLQGGLQRSEAVGSVQDGSLRRGRAEARGLPELSLLVMMGWYLMILRRDDAAAGAAAAAAAS